MTDTRFRNAIRTISLKELGLEPDSIERMMQGICNENYAVRVGERDYVFRLNEEPRFMQGSREHIPLFRSLGIAVPEIVAEDYTKSEVPFAFQMQKRIPGRDLGDVISSLTESELRGVAVEVANVFRQLSKVPNNGRFGVAFADGRDLVPSWSAEVARVTEVVRGWGRQTGVLNARLAEILDEINRDYRDYFNRIRPYTYFGDIAGKNVMVHEGRFSGLVDLDGLSQGDPLEAIGRIKSSWHGTPYGAIYTDAVMDALGLPDPQRKLVTMYALLNKVFWTLENGIQFNANTSRLVDRERERRDKATVEALYAELKGETVRGGDAERRDAQGTSVRTADIELVNLPSQRLEEPDAPNPTTTVQTVDAEPERPIEAVINLPVEPVEQETIRPSEVERKVEEVHEKPEQVSVSQPMPQLVETPGQRFSEDTRGQREQTQQVREFEAAVHDPAPAVEARPTGTEPESTKYPISEPAESHISDLRFEAPEGNEALTESESETAVRDADVAHAPLPFAVDEPHGRRLIEESRTEALPGTEIREARSRAVSRVMLEASGLTKTYESDGVAFNALRGVDLKISKGERVAIVGKSGSGKSTLMHLLACLDAPSDGYVYVDGEDTTTMSEAEKNRLRNEKFGFVFQQFFLNGRDTVFENVVLPMRIRGAADLDLASAAEDALGAVGLADKAEKPAKDLSGGEKQRVCIARALVGNPEVIFADEPTGNLDSITGEAIERLLFDLNRSKGITLIVVTHDPDLANRFERIVEMKDGRIVAQYGGTAAEARTK